jgi:hypothetical protein
LSVLSPVIAGDEDRIYPLPLMQRMAQRVADSELAVVEGCAGILWNLESPGRVYVPHAKVGYRQAISSEKARPRTRTGPFFYDCNLELWPTIAVLARLSAACMTI